MAAITFDLVQNLKQRSFLGTSRVHVGFDVSSTTIDSDNGWIDLGASNPGSTNIENTKDIYNTTTGSPSTDKYKDITKWGAKVTTEMYEYNSLILYQGIGTALTADYTAATTTAYAGTVATTGSSINTLLGNSIIALHTANAITNSLFVGDTVAVMQGTVGVYGGRYQESSIVTDRDTSANTITLEGALSNVPPAGASVVKIIYEDVIIGGNDLQTKKLRVVTSMRNGAMFIFFCNKGSMVDPVSPNLADGASAAMLPIGFEAIGQAVTLSGYSQPQVRVAQHRIVRPVYSS